MKSLRIIISTAIILSVFIFGISLFSSSSSIEQSNAEVITELSVELADLKAELNEIKGSEITSPVGMDPYIGEVILFAGNFAPRGWAFCEGQLLPISQYSALFSILGTTYGGDGRTTFALPDLRGRSPIGAGTGPGLEQIRLGAKGGAFQHTLSVSQLPSHKHSFELPTIPLEPDQLKKRMYKPGFNSLLTVENKSKNGTQASVSNTGGNQSFSIRNPYLGMHYIIALQGIYPSRS
jgi:microcystin-dependent protein